MTPVQIVLLVVGILVIQLLIWIPLMVWMRRKTAQLSAALRDQMNASGEKIALGPEAGLYRGASDRYSKVKGNGVVVLSDRRIVFQKLFGAAVDVPLDQVIGVREDKWFLRAYTSGHLHVIVQLEGGIEVGFMTPPARHATWMDAVRSAANTA